MHYVYILRSISHSTQTYVGYARDLKARLRTHNLGKSPHTSKFRPWKLFCKCNAASPAVSTSSFVIRHPPLAFRSPSNAQRTSTFAKGYGGRANGRVGGQAALPYLTASAPSSEPREWVVQTRILEAQRRPSVLSAIAFGDGGSSTSEEGPLSSLPPALNGFPHTNATGTVAGPTRQPETRPQLGMGKARQASNALKCLLSRTRFPGFQQMTLEERIMIEPDRRSGKPCIRGMRITVYDVFEWLAAGMSAETILQEYSELTEEDIRACYKYAANREKRLLTA